MIHIRLMMFLVSRGGKMKKKKKEKKLVPELVVMPCKTHTSSHLLKECIRWDVKMWRTAFA